MSNFEGFGPDFFGFLADLKASNDRDWFNANKGRYEAEVKAPLLAFIEAIAAPLADAAPALLAIPKVQGGSMFRIHRDTRFSKDKSPYKTHAAAHFRHETTGDDVHGPGVYLHLEPGTVFAGAGVYGPGPKALAAIRARMDARPDEWHAARERVEAALGPIHGDSLSRPPKGFSRDHPLIEDIKRKTFFLRRDFCETAAGRAGFVEEVAGVACDAAPLMAFLCAAQGLRW